MMLLIQRDSQILDRFTYCAVLFQLHPGFSSFRLSAAAHNLRGVPPCVGVIATTISLRSRRLALAFHIVTMSSGDTGAEGAAGEGGSVLLNQPIVLDNGTASVKAGFAGGSKPKVSLFLDTVRIGPAVIEQNLTTSV
jgi:hypothetical protein